MQTYIRFFIIAFLLGGTGFLAYRYMAVHGVDPVETPILEKIDHVAKRAASRQLVAPIPSHDMESIENKMTLAVELVDNGDVDEAADILEAVLKVEPENIKALLEMSLIELLDRGRPHKALPYLVTALRVDPDNDHLLGEVADIYVETGQYDEGLKFFNKLRSHFPNIPAVNLRVGQIYYYQSDFSRALQVLSKLQPNTSHGFQAESLRARINLQQGRVDLAVVQYGKAYEGLEEHIRRSMVSDEPADFLVKWLETMQLELAEGLIRLERYKLAEDILYDLSEKNPSDPEVVKLMNLARTGKQAHAG